MDFATLEEKAKSYLPAEKIALIKNAASFAERCHDGQKRLSGEPYFQHPLYTALTLAELQLDASSICAALLHDVTEDCGTPLSEIESKFGEEVARLVDGTTKFSRLSRKASEKRASVAGEDAKNQAENLRKMLVAMARDLRVVFIKLADRQHNMRTLDALSPEKQRLIARETLDIYAPLAHRLGIWQLKWQLEDLAFSYLQPEEYHHIASLLAARRTERENFVSEVASRFKAELDRVGIKADVVGRPKHIYSIYRKMEKYAAQGKHFSDIHDLLAVRVLVDTVKDCYGALGVVHSLWHPLPGEFDDYIANSKDNGYQSLHTTVMYQGTTPLEIQIRTYEMHSVADYGVAAHWRYKEGEKRDKRFEGKIAWLRQLIEWQKDMTGAEEFIESLKTDVFKDQVFVFTPKGVIKDMPKGATPLDFAYIIHTDLGHRCIGAKVNGKLVPLNYELRNGDTVEIIASKVERGPSRDWLNTNLGYVTTAHSRTKIKQWFNKQERTENVERGKQLLEKEMRRLGLGFSSQEEIAALLGYEDMEDFYAALGCGEVSPNQIAVKLSAQQKEAPAEETVVLPARAAPVGIKVLGVGDLLTRLAPCCQPVPGDDIIGYVTRARGVTVHRKDCPNILHEDEKERLIQVEWGQVGTLYPVSIQVDALDRVGLLRDISALVAEEGVNMASVSALDRADNTASISIILEIKSLEQLSRIMARIEAIGGVINVSRSGEVTKKKS